MHDDAAPEAGAYEVEPVLDVGAPSPPDESGNPPGVSRGDCDDEDTVDPGCDIEITAHVEDLVMGETMPGFGIPGYDAEEDGGG